MLFFALLAGLSGFFVLLHLARVPGLADWPSRMRLAMAIALALIGIDHWATPSRYLAMMPGWLPLHLELVLFTGVCEIAGAFGLLVPRLRPAAGALLALYFVMVFPANIHNAVNGVTVEGLPDVRWYYWLRLAFQPLAVWWALYAAGLIAWPRRRAVGGSAS